MAPTFTDKDRPPTEETVLAALGKAATAFRLLFERIRAEHPDLTHAFRYYADAKGWLLKVTRKSTTMFWLEVEEGAFRVSFTFPERLTGALLASDLTEERKAAIRSRPADGKLRSVSLTFGPQRGVRDVMTLIALKKTLK